MTQWLEDLWRDVLYGARTLGRTPGFTGVAVLTLALGIGAVTIIYSVVRNVLLNPFPYADSDRLVNVLVRDASGKIVGSLFPADEFLDYQEQTTVFEDVVGMKNQPGLYGSSDTGAARLNIAWMTPNGFAFFGISALLGRTFGAGEQLRGLPDLSNVDAAGLATALQEKLGVPAYEQAYARGQGLSREAALALIANN